jgi:hypothetical protein
MVDTSSHLEASASDANDGAPAEAESVEASGEGGDAGVDNCVAYCALMEQYCTGESAQFAPLDAGGHAECMNACYQMGLGTASDDAGNTVGCRITQATTAQSTNMPNPYCWYAGPFGYGQCGDPCADFCALTLAWCSPDAGYAGPVPYASADDCASACAFYRRIDSSDGGPVFYDGGFSGNGSVGNTLDCREYYLESAMASGAQREVHCPHTAFAQLADAALGFPCTGP